MRRPFLAVSVVVCLAAIPFLPGVASAWQERILAVHHIAVDRPRVDVSAWLQGPGDPIQVELRGTITNGLDGTTLDALSRWSGDTRLLGDDPWVQLPADVRLLERDPEAHRYLLEVPRHSDGVFELTVRRLAHEHFVTPTELRDRTTGSIELRVLAPPAAPATSGPPRMASPVVSLPAAAVGAAAASVPLAVLLLFGLGRRRRQREDRALLRRARSAVRTIEHEADQLGPAFADVATASRRMLDAIAALQRHLVDIRAAARRTRHLRSSGARERREELMVRETETLVRMRGMVDHLETTATHLAAHSAGSTRAPDLARVLRDLDAELDLAVTADTEAHAEQNE